ncbi:hypothetical protein HZA97_09145 [Candidatus Woesearchaeota archaeon]|nr:hypothetical protein [Candidatus Woesearchaeota archaeon]
MNKMLQKELLNMMKVDQEIRKTGKYDPQIIEVGKKHTERLKDIVKEYGWPTYDLVGKKASFAAWLILQHSDLDKNFQRKCLKLLEEAVEKGQSDKTNLAYLTDRVRVNNGKKQVYGTQFYLNPNGEYGPRPIQNPKEIEERRKKMGLEPFKDYLDYMIKRNKK